MKRIAIFIAALALFAVPMGSASVAHAAAGHVASVCNNCESGFENVYNPALYIKDHGDSKTYTVQDAGTGFIAVSIEETWNGWPVWTFETSTTSNEFMCAEGTTLFWDKPDGNKECQKFVFSASGSLISVYDSDAYGHLICALPNGGAGASLGVEACSVGLPSQYWYAFGI